MKISKVLNNSTVIVKENHLELVVMGKGISFGKKVGDRIDPSAIEKRFWLDNEQNAGRLAKLLAEIPIAYFEIVRDLVDIAETELAVELNDTIYLSLTEHIHFAVMRFRDGLVTPNAILFEIATIYQAEYQFALRALTYIEQQLGLRLPNDEAGFIALHLIIAQSNSSKVNKVTELALAVYEISCLVQEFYQLSFAEDDIHYARFVIHLKFLLLRLWKGEQMSDEDAALYQSLVQQHERAKQVLPEIAAYLESKYGYRLSEGEAFYLTLHIQRLLQ